MRDILVDGIPWLLSATTIFTIWTTGNKRRVGWLVGAVSQAVWLLWIVLSGSWGLLPLTAVLSVLYTRNYRKWAQTSEE